MLDRSAMGTGIVVADVLKSVSTTRYDDGGQLDQITLKRRDGIVLLSCRYTPAWRVCPRLAMVHLESSQRQAPLPLADARFDGDLVHCLDSVLALAVSAAVPDSVQFLLFCAETSIPKNRCSWEQVYDRNGKPAQD
jgi:hypothetical protein